MVLVRPIIFFPVDQQPFSLVVAAGTGAYLGTTAEFRPAHVLKRSILFAVQHQETLLFPVHCGRPFFTAQGKQWQFDIMVGTKALAVDDNKLFFIRFFDDLALFNDFAVGHKEKFVVALGCEDEGPASGIEHRTLDVKTERAVFAAVGKHIPFFVQFAPYCPVLAVGGELDFFIQLVPGAEFFSQPMHVAFPILLLFFDDRQVRDVGFFSHRCILAFSP